MILVERADFREKYKRNNDTEPQEILEQKMNQPSSQIRFCHTSPERSEEKMIG